MSMTIDERNGTVAALEDLERNGTVAALEDLERNGTAGALEEVERNGTAEALKLEDEATDYLADQDTGHDAPAQAHPIRLDENLRTPDSADTADRPEGGPALAVFCYEDPDGFVGQYVSWVAGLVAARGIPVHVFGRRPFAEGAPGVHNHAVGDCDGDDVLGSVREFTRRTCDAFRRAFPFGAAGVTLLAHDWSAVPAALTLKATHGLEVLVEYHSLEWQRTDVVSETARQIAEIELSGLREARTILVHQA